MLLFLEEERNTLIFFFEFFFRALGCLFSLEKLNSYINCRVTFVFGMFHIFRTPTQTTREEKKIKKKATHRQDKKDDDDDDAFYQILTQFSN